MSAELISTLLGSRVMAMSTVQKEQVRGVDQTPYQSWHSPLRWATRYAHEVAKNKLEKGGRGRKPPPPFELISQYRPPPRVCIRCVHWTCFVWPPSPSTSCFLALGSSRFHSLPERVERPSASAEETDKQEASDVDARWTWIWYDLNRPKVLHGLC